MKILLVDDVKMERIHLAIRLKQLGHLVEHAESGAQALAVYPEFSPDLVLMDITMPDMNGFDASREIRRLYPEEWIPIIFLSGHDEPTMIKEAIDAGGDDYLIKPVNQIVLSSKLTAMQRIAEMRHKLHQQTKELENANLRLEQLAKEDGLTKLLNRRAVDKYLKDMISIHGRHQLPLSIILLDVDNFKAYNDNYGHVEGDRCLVLIAEILMGLFGRKGEVVGRYGGEEFVVLLDHTDLHQAEIHAKRIKSELELLCIEHKYSDTSPWVTLSQGVISPLVKGYESPEILYKKADDLLYKAKHKGKNCFVLEE
ncbi:diguanylate cyclase [Vibrio sinensis]|uniref:diguanylate cyclase n=1 Tax=Vibrio sinensis TaxID=2302434 RepID=A0A3A6R3R8_9VIBR|nr:diguanylate cyclase [Vibrio sinensis]RJX75787.1 diguanylate cyclase [Vibrio sinensis]